MVVKKNLSFTPKKLSRFPKEQSRRLANWNLVSSVNDDAPCAEVRTRCSHFHSDLHIPRLLSVESGLRFLITRLLLEPGVTTIRWEIVSELDGGEGIVGTGDR